MITKTAQDTLEKQAFLGTLGKGLMKRLKPKDTTSINPKITQGWGTNPTPKINMSSNRKFYPRNLTTGPQIPKPQGPLSGATVISPGQATPAAKKGLSFKSMGIGAAGGGLGAYMATKSNYKNTAQQQPTPYGYQ